MVATAPAPRLWTDAHGRAWPLDLTLPLIGEVNAVLGLNVLDIMGGQPIDAMATDPVKLARALAAAFEVAPADLPAFLRGLRGEALQDAQRLFWDNVGDFLPEDAAEALRRLFAKTMAIHAELCARFAAGIDAVDVARVVAVIEGGGKEKRPARRRARKDRPA